MLIIITWLVENCAVLTHFTSVARTQDPSADQIKSVEMVSSNRDETHARQNYTSFRHYFIMHMVINIPYDNLQLHMYIFLTKV